MRSKDFYALKQKAAEYAQREKFEKAINIYYSLLQDAPEDTGLLLKIGNIHQTIGQENAAINVYLQVLETYYSRQMYQQGIAVCRMILAVDPLHILAQQRLVEMYTKVYGGLPKKRGDTIVPPAFVAEDETLSISPGDEQQAASSTGIEKRSDSWSPVDVVFSNTDAAPPELDDGTFPVVGNSVNMLSDEESHDGAVEFSAEDCLLVESFPEIPLFAPIDKNELTRIVHCSPLVRFNQNDFILKEGQAGDSFYVILSGSVQVLKGDLMKSVARLGAGACFGEMALFGPKARRASVLAVEPTVLLEIGRAEIEELQNRFPSIRRTLRRYVKERLLDNLLVTSALFSPFSDDIHSALRSRFQPEEFIPFETIFRRGEEVAFLYLIVDGRAEVLLDIPKQRRQLIRTMGIGEIFGEIPLLTDSSSKVTIRAKGRLSTLCLSKKEFKSLMKRHPDILHLVSDLLASAEPTPNLHL